MNVNLATTGGKNAFVEGTMLFYYLSYCIITCERDRRVLCLKNFYLLPLIKNTTHQAPNPSLPPAITGHLFWTPVVHPHPSKWRSGYPLQCV